MITVLGSTGLIGSAVVRALIRYGVDPRDIRGVHQHNWRAYARHSKVDHYLADLRKPNHARRVCYGSDTIFVCAAVTSGATQMVKNPLVHVANNIILNASVFQAAHETGARVIFVSSSTVYPKNPQSHYRWKEREGTTGPPEPVYWWVSTMKRQAEKLLLGYATKAKRPIQTMIIRPSNAYGPYDKFSVEYAHFIGNKIREVAGKRDPLVVWGDPYSSRDYIYVDDLAAQMVQLSNQDHGKHSIFNIGSGSVHSVKEVIEVLVSIADYSPTIMYDDEKPTTASHRAIDCAQIDHFLPGRTLTPLYQGLQRTYDWYKGRYNVE